MLNFVKQPPSLRLRTIPIRQLRRLLAFFRLPRNTRLPLLPQPQLMRLRILTADTQEPLERHSRPMGDTQAVLLPFLTTTASLNKWCSQVKHNTRIAKTKCNFCDLFLLDFFSVLKS